MRAHHYSRPVVARALLLAPLLSMPLVVPPVTAADAAGADHDDAYVYRLPYGEGVDYLVMQSYGSRFSHTGREFYTIDFAMPEGTIVHAAREGVVKRVDASNTLGCFRAGCEAFANHVIVAHGDGTLGEYFHLREGGVLVAEGDFVARGQPIALSGNTGYSNSPHLHFGVYAVGATGKPHSLEVRFATTTGLVRRLRVGRRYRNLEEDRLAQR